jgi:hypothetical protein
VGVGLEVPLGLGYKAGLVWVRVIVRVSDLHYCNKIITPNPLVPLIGEPSLSLFGVNFIRHTCEFC